MKKLLFVAFVFGGLALTSCKKDYTCTVGTGENAIVTPFNDLNSSDADDAGAACETAGIGTWEEQ